jgi:adenylate kinase family enzyme
MERIAVVGVSGSGKSAVAAAAAARLGHRHVELDSIHHLPDWEPIETTRFREIISDVVAGTRWVIDGNYPMVQDIVFAAADTIVWLDLPRRVVMPALTRRTFTRMVRREELWNGNRERFRNLFDLRPEQNILLWSWTSHRKLSDRYLGAMDNAADVDQRWVRLRSRRAIGDWLASLPEGTL